MGGISVSTEKKKILIVDDSEMNRSILSDMLCSDFDIIEAENGMEAASILHMKECEISLMLLDIVMPVMDGFETLKMMEKNGWDHSVPVVMISAETSTDIMEKAYDMGVLDFIIRPFDGRIVRRKVTSTLMLATKKKELEKLVIKQVYEKEKDNKLMIAILSHLVEFRNGESGLHVLHIRMITELLLHYLVKKNEKYNKFKKYIPVICNAAALHDIGKILIPEEILNKPGRFTDEEFAIMKTHSEKGAEILKSLDVDQSEPLLQAGYEICRWHHERYDGRGYPDGLKGDEIPLTAQVVSIADVYDALTSERVYKKAYSHEKAVNMILNGECGVFNPELLEAFQDVAEEIKGNLRGESLSDYTNQEIADTVGTLMYGDEFGVSDRTLTLLEHERTKYKFFSELSKEVQFEYMLNPEMIQLSEWGAKHLGISEIINNPRDTKFGKEIFNQEDFEDLLEKFKQTSKSEPLIECNYLLNINGEQRLSKIIARSMWDVTDKGEAEYVGAIGKIVDIHEDMKKLNSLEEKATHDSLTGLFNHATAKSMIKPLLEAEEKNYVLCLFDLDHFKQANDTYGHLFGDEVLKYVADTLKHSVRDGDITARMGGDEFLMFMSYADVHKLKGQIERIYKNLCGQYKEFKVGISMGVACSSDCNKDYDTLFHMADEALYAVKRNGRGNYRINNADMIQAI